MPALYTARRFETAWLEAQQAFPFKAQPMTLCAYEVDCDVLDLTDSCHSGTARDRPSRPPVAWKDFFYMRDQAAILGDHGATCRGRNRQASSSPASPRGPGASRRQRRVLGLGPEPAAPGPCDR